jgi:hypothetical protein
MKFQHKKIAFRALKKPFLDENLAYLNTQKTSKVNEIKGLC